MGRRVVIYKIRQGVAVRSFDFGENIYVEYWGGDAYCKAVDYCIRNKLDVLLLSEPKGGNGKRHTGSYR